MSPLPPLKSLSLGDFLDQLGAKTPAPGGGAAASVAGAVAASLGRMVVAFSVGKKSLAEHQDALERSGQILARASDLLLTLAEEDAAAYSYVSELSKLPENDPRRVAEWPAAVDAAIGVPRALAGAAADLLRLLESLAPITNKFLKSDLAVAALLAEAAAKAGWWNVKANLGLLTDRTAADPLVQEMQALLADAAARRERIEQACD